MKIRIKAKDVEIEYEEEGRKDASYYFMTGKCDKGDHSMTDKYMACLQQLIDSVEQLLKA
jgi:hypothetical protein